METTLENDPVHDRFNLLVNAPALFNAVATAAEIGIFSFLSDNPGSGFEDVQAKAGLPRHQLRVLLQAVCSTGLLERAADGGYANSRTAQQLLASDADDSWVHILIGWREVYYPAFAQMTAALRAGTNTALAAYPGDEPTLYQRLSRNPELEAVFHRAMTAFTLRSVEALVERPEFGSVRRLLDIGGGDGATSARLVKRHSQLHSTVFDLPSVSTLANDRSPTQLPEGVELHPGDIFKEPYRTGADAVLFSHVLEIFDEEQIVGQLQKAYDVLPAGGKVFVYGYNVSDDETEGVFGARLGLYFNILASGQGMAYPARDYEDWLRRVGFRDVSTVTGLPYEHGLTLGTK